MSRRISVTEFCDITGCTMSMASHIRAGRRVPNTSMLLELHRRLNHPLTPLVEAHSDGPESFGRYARVHIFKED